MPGTRDMSLYRGAAREAPANRMMTNDDKMSSFEMASHGGVTGLSVYLQALNLLPPGRPPSNYNIVRGDTAGAASVEGDVPGQAGIDRGADPRSGRGYLYLETLGGGFGGRAAKDGRDGAQVHITNTSNLPFEAIEMEYPLIVESYGLVEDSGGPGTYRGGMGLSRVIRPVDGGCEFNGAGERFTHQPWGLFGGGAGGYGAPGKRAAQALAEDLASGKFSAAYLKRHYGYSPGED